MANGCINLWGTSMKTSGPAALAACIIMTVAGTAAQAQTTVNGNGDLYRAGGPVNDGGSDPTEIALNGATSLTFDVSGSITLNSGGNYNDADGTGSASDVEVNSFNDISGISAYQAGFLAGVFEGTTQTTTPPGLTYNAASEAEPSYSPLLQQAFFIGDGLEGDGSGAKQTFFVPAGATSLFLGITDAGGYHGDPGSYGDNSGAFNVTVAGNGGGGSVSAAPEPSTWALMLGGIGILGGMMRVAQARRREDGATGMSAA